MCVCVNLHLFPQAANPYVIKLSVLDDEIALNVSTTCWLVYTCLLVSLAEGLEPQIIAWLA